MATRVKMPWTSQYRPNTQTKAMVVLAGLTSNRMPTMMLRMPPIRSSHHGYCLVSKVIASSILALLSYSSSIVIW
jgi:hypothetical protein